MPVDADTDNIFDGLYRLLDRHEMWQARLRQYLNDNLVRVNRDGYTWEQFERGRRELESELKKQSDPLPELFGHFERMCSMYLNSDPTGRAEIRDRVGDRQGLGQLVRSYADHLATDLKGVEDTPKLRLALAAVLIENCSSDYRDTLTTLADLYVRAEEVGIGPKVQFQLASDLATNVFTTGGCESLARMLREFESYAVVAERRTMGRPYRDQA
jgi:hypothetical protein